MLDFKKQIEGLYYAERGQRGTGDQVKLLILEFARESVNTAKICRKFGVSRSSFYRWKKAFYAEGRACVTRIRQSESQGCIKPGGTSSPDEIGISRSFGSNPIITLI